MPSLKITEAALDEFPAPTDAAQAYLWDTEVAGFGAVVGRTGAITFVAQGWIRGRHKRSKVKIGRRGELRDDGSPWNATRARQRAREVLAQIGAGVDLNAPPATSGAHGPTLRQALDLHIANMRKRNRSGRSIGTIEAEIPRLLPTWLDRPLAELRGADLVALHDRLTEDGKPYLANRIVAHVSAVWNTADRVHELDGRNPARAVERNRYQPSRERIDDEALPAWWARVQGLSPVRRDLRVFCLLTGMRVGAATQARWEHFDAARGVLEVPRPKGGEARAFTLPLAPGVVTLLVDRRKANAVEFGPHGGDQGWIFPSLSRDATRVQPIAEPKEYRRDPKTGRKVRFLPPPHAARRTLISVASEIGISELDRHVLVNHSYGRQTVNATYIKQSIEHLRDCAARIESAILERAGAVPRRVRRARRA